MFLIIALLAMTLYWGCEQGDDVFSPVATTTLNLTVERLPEPPDSMVYELWVGKNVITDTAVSAGDVVSLGKFSYMISDTMDNAFLDLNGNPREDSNQFVLDGDLFSYKSIFVSVETIDDLDPDKPGPIMLIDYIVPLDDFTPTLNFPLSEDSLWSATARFNLEAVSDDNSGSNDSRGIWFCNYRTTLDTIPDTYDLAWDFRLCTIPMVLAAVVDTIVDSFGDTTFDTLTLDTLNKDSLFPNRPWEITNIRVDTTQILYGPDTLLLGLDSYFVHIYVLFDVDSMADSSEPFVKRELEFIWNYDTAGADTNTVTYDIFNQDEYGLPDYSGWGWKYEGWIVSPYIEYADQELTPRFTPPAWPYKSSSVNWFPGDTGGVFSTGTFTHINAPDDGDPYTLDSIAGIRYFVDTLTGDTIPDTVRKRPQYPGEDFLNTAALLDSTNGQLSSIEILPAAPPGGGPIEGTVYISLEPANRKMTRTNFPLIAFFRAVPSVRPGPQEAYFITMLSGYSDVPGSGWGFPEIKVKFSRL